ncbi:hypothetical protein BC829DRAFT_117003 [Chytridium lagenaria]|nr:hypothetical protein BC829DRAFT_117003 [Chytridium lagenaria]
MIEVWDDTMSSRKWMLNQLSFLTRLRVAKDEYMVSQCLAIAKAARKQHLFSVAQKWLAATERSSGAFHPQFSYEYCKFLLGRFEKDEALDVKVKLIDNAVRHLAFFKEDIAELDAVKRGRFQMLQLSVRAQFVDFLFKSETEAVITSLSDLRTIFLNDVGGKLDLDSLIKHLTAMSFADDWTADEREVSYLELAKTRCKYDYKMSDFLDKVLRAYELESISENALDLEKIVRRMITSLLRSMRGGSLRATNLFPRLLQIIELYSVGTETFTEESSNIPTWMFLKWLPQMTALLDKKSWKKVFPILNKVAKIYPNALRFPFNISLEQYNTDKLDQSNRAAIDKLRSALESTTISNFVRELRRLQDPVHLFKDFCERIEALILSQDTQKRTKLIDECKGFEEVCLDKQGGNGLIGKAFSAKHASALLKIFKRFETENEIKFPDILKALAAYKIQIKSEGESKAGAVDLKNFSLWLESYHSANFKESESLEIPGQYDVDYEPNVQRHATIVRFSPHVLVMSSMRRPKRIKMVGSDEKSYPWLVKGGEDLRLDQRIQQMFEIMNKLMAVNPFCVRSGISLVTYKVIPMSNSLGIIEWVEGTKPLKACMADNDGFDNNFKDAQRVYSEFVKSYGAKNQSVVACFDPFLQSAKRKDVTDTMGNLYGRTQRSYLREFLSKLSASPEAFFDMRTNFANSLSALNICSYLLGIGDRHLDNFLVDLKIGKIIGIDFGHAFGSATEVLPVPELVPFRLTKQMERLGAFGCCCSDEASDDAYPDCYSRREGYPFERVGHFCERTAD